MYFDKIKQMEAGELKAYNSTILDGRPRSKWYIKAICAVSEIEFADEEEDITYMDFSKYRSLYESVQWVAKNDPEALRYIMGEMLVEVTHLVKEKLLKYLNRFNYQEASAIVKEHLKGIPVPKERIIRRRVEEARVKLKKDFIPNITRTSDFLKHVKVKDPELPNDEELIESLSHLLNLDGTGYKKKGLMKEIKYMEHMRLYAFDELKELLSITICKEIKDQLLSHVAAKEYYQLCQLIQTVVEVLPSTFYYPIPPPQIEYSENDDYYGDIDDDDDWF